MKPRVLHVPLLVLATSSCGPSSTSQTEGSYRMNGVEIVDFGQGIDAANHPAGSDAYGVWYDATDNTFGTPFEGTLEGLPALRVDDGGFTNGVYSIFADAVPTDGTYVVRARVQVVEDVATQTDGIRALELGVSVGNAAVHRGPNPSAVAPTTVAGAYPGLTPDDDTSAGAQWVETDPFAASAGDDLLLAIGTDVRSGAWNANAGAWSGAYVLVGSPQLVPVEVEEPATIVDNDDGSPAYTEVGGWTTSSGTGYAGGTYRFASAGAPSRATWSAELLAGYYDVDTTYSAGTNRSPSAHYTVWVDGAPIFDVTIDQRYRDLSWVSLGPIEVPEGASVEVTLDAEQSGTEGVVIADAVRFVPSEGPPPIDPPEIRLAAITVFDPIDDVGAIQVIVDELAELHYNAVAVHARYRGDATYVPNRSDATYDNPEPRSPLVGEVDVLEEFVSRGHAAGLKVFAYVNTHLVTDGADAVADPNHIVNRRPELRTWAYRSGAPAVQTTLDDPEGLWLDPALEGTRSYLADIVGDIALNYPIDGVILDRIRYPQTAFVRENADFGYHPDAIASFNFWYGKSGIPDPYDPDWIEFRQLAVERNVAAIYDRLEAIDEQLVLLAYPIGRFQDAVEFNYQNWPNWLRTRSLDGVLPQIYTSDDAAFASRLEEQLAAYGGDRFVGVTTLAFVEGVSVADQLESAWELGADGVSPFRHGVMGPLGYLEDLEIAWDGIAEFPELPWKGQPIGSLELTPLCSDDPSTQRRWQVHNPNAWAIEISYWLLGTPQYDAMFVPPGDTVITTDAKRGPNALLVSWLDDEFDLQGRVELSRRRTCD